MIELDIILKYIDFIKKNNKNNKNDIVIFLEIGDKYYMFYNETFGVNANELNIKFEFDGRLNKGDNIYYYVAFQSKNLDYYIKKITGYNIIFLDNNFIQKNININNFIFNKNNDYFGLQLIEKYIAEFSSPDNLDNYKSPSKKFNKTISMIIDDEYEII